MNTQKQSRKIIPSKPLLAVILATLLIGISPCFVKITDIGPNATGFFRMFFSFWVLIVLSNFKTDLRSYEKTFSGGAKLLVILSGLFLALDLACWHVSLHYTEIVNSSLFNNMTPVFMPLLIWLFYAKTPDRRLLFAIVIAIIGSAIVAGEEVTFKWASLKGDLLAMLGAVFYAGYILAMSKLRTSISGLKVMTWTTFCCGSFMLLFAVLSGEKIMLTTTTDWVATLGLALLVHTGGQGLLTYAMGYLSASFISLVVLSSTVVAGIAGWIMFGEELSWLQFCGAAIVISAIVYANHIEQPAVADKS